MVSLLCDGLSNRVRNCPSSQSGFLKKSLAAQSGGSEGSNGPDLLSSKAQLNTIGLTTKDVRFRLQHYAFCFGSCFLGLSETS